MPIASYTLALADHAATSLDALTGSERREHDRLPHESRRRDWLAGRIAAKRAVAAHYEALPLEHIQLESREASTPRCMVRDDIERWTLAPLFLSIAHRDGVAVAAAARLGTRVGVDIERAGEIESNHLRYFLARSEIDAARRLGATFFWVLKEAVWKALDLGPGLPFTSVQLAFARGTKRRTGIWVDGTWMSARARVIHVPQTHKLLAAAVEIEQETQ